MPCHSGRKRAECGRIDRLDLAPQARQRSTPEQPQDVGVAPLAFRAARPELAAEQRAGGEQPLQRVLDDADRQTPAPCRVGRQERAVRTGPAGEQPVERAADRREERLGHPDRGGDADAIPIAGDILDGDPALLAGDPGPDRAPPGGQLVEPRTGDIGPALDPGRQLVGAQVAEAAKEVVDPVGGRRPPVVGQRLEGQLEVGERVGVEQLAQLLLPEQLAQQVAVERQRAGSPLGQGRVAVVHVGGDVVEQEAARERARPLRLDAVDRDVTAGDAGQDLAQRRQVEDVAQALAVGLDEDREAAVARGDREQVGGPLALLPERRPGPRPAARQEQGPCRVLAEAAGEQRRRRHLPDDQVLDLVGLGEEQRLDAVEWRVALGQPDGDAVVGPDRLDLEAESLGEAALDRHRPRGVDTAAERGQQRQPPVAQLVAEAFEHDPLVGRQAARRLAFVLEIREQVLGGTLVEVVLLAQSRRGRAATRGALREVGLELADERAHRTSELDRAAHGVALPERQLAGHAGRWRDGHPVVADLVDPPAAGAEDDDVAMHPRAELVDHLLVELADAPAGRPRLADHEHAVQAAVRDRAATGDRHDARVAPALDDVGHAVPDDARLELGELVRRVGAGQHAQHALEQVAGQRLVRRRPGDRLEQVRDRPAVHDRHRDELLGEDVERVARDGGRLDGAVVHPLRHDRDLEQVAAVLREDDALARAPRPGDRRGRPAAGPGRRSSGSRPG